MVLNFGELPVRIRKIMYYTLCATHQRFWAKSISHGLPNFLKRSMHALVPMVPAFLSTVVIVKWANEEYRRSKRKDRKLNERDA
ncbi:cytochrome b-c1 complex subunit 8-like [Bombus bifarius]|uniref:Cytochrome b-c1 complex subunit 8 n=1 Tax=Bombus bifarius TaxID=103933 RepID=A0A6P8NGC0_9HYME|nr:cytochrome b-c1 complex subunit 8-like [Bombus vancouverensis nearcticus]XP_033313612.1 cytochrome b-c1 complex subunit 8-like [Bombus bifarius]